MSETVSQMTDFAKLQRWAHENYVDLLPGEWMGYHTLVLEKGCHGVSVHSDDCKVVFHFDKHGEFVDILLTCETCQQEKA